MGFFKKALRIVHPAMRLFDKRGGDTENAGRIGVQQGHAQDIDSAMADYNNIPTQIRDQYTSAAKKAGTYANTNEFNSGLNSEVNAGVRGARVNAVNRINALRKAAGITEEFKPEGYDQTQANNTQNTLAEQPMKEDAPQAAESTDPTQDTAPVTNNAATNVQNARRLAALRAVQG